MWEFRDIKQNRTLYAQANSNLPIRIQTVEQLIGRYSKQQRAAGCYYNRQQTRSSLAADSSAPTTAQALLLTHSQLAAKL
jgi:hypothetical protein